MLLVTSMGAIGSSCIVKTILEILTGNEIYELFWGFDSIFHLCIAIVGIYLSRLLASHSH